MLRILFIYLGWAPCFGLGVPFLPALLGIDFFFSFFKQIFYHFLIICTYITYIYFSVLFPNKVFTKWINNKSKTITKKQKQHQNNKKLVKNMALKIGIHVVLRTT